MTFELWHKNIRKKIGQLWVARQKLGRFVVVQGKTNVSKSATSHSVFCAIVRPLHRSPSLFGVNKQPCCTTMVMDLRGHNKKLGCGMTKCARELDGLSLILLALSSLSPWRDAKTYFKLIVLATSESGD